jgi:hypothetical protein
LCSRSGSGLLLLECLLLSGGHDDNGFTPLPISPTSTTLLTAIPHLINGTDMDHHPDIGGIDSQSKRIHGHDQSSIATLLTSHNRLLLVSITDLTVILVTIQCPT